MLPLMFFQWLKSGKFQQEKKKEKKKSSWSAFSIIGSRGH